MDDIFDEQGFSKINSIAWMHGYDPETKLYMNTFQHPLVEGSSLPANATMVEPISDPKGVNRWDGTKWIDDIEYGNKLKVEDRRNTIATMEENLHKELARLTLKQSVNRITEEEDTLRLKIINFLIDLDEFDVEDLTKEIPTF